MDFSKIAYEAMKEGKRIKLIYHPTDTSKDEHRIAEVHAVGLSRKGRLCMRVFQTGGSSVYSESVGWKMLSFDDADDIQITDEASEAPRPGFNPGDRGMASILMEVSDVPVPNDSPPS